MISQRNSAETFFLALPKISPFSFGDEPVNFGDSTSVQCTVSSGDFPISIRWLLNNQAIGNDARYLGISTAKLGKRVNALTIDSVAEQHAGNYTCEASNHAGVEISSAVLIVNGIFES